MLVECTNLNTEYKGTSLTLGKQYFTICEGEQNYFLSDDNGTLVWCEKKNFNNVL